MTRLWQILITVGLLTLVSCLEEPEIDKRWTLVEFLDAQPLPVDTLSASQPVDVSVRGRITYRRIVTGFLVAEARYSSTLTPAALALNPAQHTVAEARDIDMILANSVTAGRATRAVTGFDHLMQEFQLSFTAQVPAAMFPGGGPATGGMFLLLYMGDGDEIRLNDGRDSLVVTPFVSGDTEVLHTGFGLNVAPPGGSTP